MTVLCACAPGACPLPLISMSDAAKALGVSRRMLVDARQRRPGLPCHGEWEKGNPVRVNVAEVKAWLEANGLGFGQGRRPRAVELAREAQKPPAGSQAASGGSGSTTPPKLSQDELADLGQAFDGLDHVERALRLPSDALRRLSAVAAAKKEFADEVQKQRGQLLDAATVERGRVQRILVVKQGLVGMPARVAPRLVGKTQEEIQAELDAEIDSACRAFAEEFAKL
jgi:hypothetical protein